MSRIAGILLCCLSFVLGCGPPFDRQNALDDLCSETGLQSTDFDHYGRCTFAVVRKGTYKGYDFSWGFFGCTNEAIYVLASTDQHTGTGKHYLKHKVAVEDVKSVGLHRFLNARQLQFHMKQKNGLVLAVTIVGKHGVADKKTSANIFKAMTAQGVPEAKAPHAYAPPDPKIVIR